MLSTRRAHLLPAACSLRSSRLWLPLLRAALGLGPGERGQPTGRAVSGGRVRDWLQPSGHDTGVKVYNSLTRRKDPLIVANAEAVSWYSCGPTVYDHAHLGHACSYVRFDIIRRILTKVFGCNIVTVMGITDVDDKIIKRANEMNVSPTSLARLYEEDFKQDMAALKVLPPTVYLRVTENVPQIISFIKGIIANGHAYSTVEDITRDILSVWVDNFLWTFGSNVYFDVKSRGDKYGKLVGVAPDPLGEPADSDKRHAKDFALWKAAKPQEIFGHLPGEMEDLAGILNVLPYLGKTSYYLKQEARKETIIKYGMDDLSHSLVFGSQLDIHSGGVDLAFPHHENEIAQCEVFHQCQQWGNYFLHSGHLHVKGKEEKMSKSLKNYIAIKDFLKNFSPDVFRLFCMRSSYRSAIDYSDSTMHESKHLLLGISSFLEDAQAYMKGQLVCDSIREDLLWERLANTKVAVQAAFADDFDTPRALDAIMDLIHHGNRQLKAVTKETGGPRSPAVFGSMISYIEQFLETVGISLANQQFISGDSSSATLQSVVDELVQFRLKVRQYALATQEASREARQQRLLERQPLLQACDALRKDLAVHGINIKDRSSTTSTWELLDQRIKD